MNKRFIMWIRRVTGRNYENDI